MIYTTIVSDFLGSMKDGRLFNQAKDISEIYEKPIFILEGQMKKALEYTRLRLTLMKEYMPPYLVSLFTIFSMGEYIRAGEEQEAFRILETLKQQLKPPIDSFISFGYLMAYLELERTSEAELLLPKVEKLIAESGMKILEIRSHQAKGRIQQLKGEHTKAIESFQKALEFKPLDENFLRRIGQCLRELKQYEKAEKPCRPL